jgi:hypothetical protein
VEALGPLLLVLAVPLMLRWVPRNRLYGFRVAATLRDDAVWYEVNASAGRQSVMLGALMVTLEFVLPLSLRNGTLSTVGVVGLVLITTIGWRRANRLARERHL